MSYEDSEYQLEALRSDLDHHLNRKPLANSTHHPLPLPKKICEEIANQYSVRGWSVGYSVGKGTSFSFIRS